MTLFDKEIFPVSLGLLWGNPTVYRLIPLTEGQWRGDLCFVACTPEHTLNKQLDCRWFDTRSCDVNVRIQFCCSSFVVAILSLLRIHAVHLFPSGSPLSWIRQFGLVATHDGNIVRVIGPLCGEFTGHRWIPLTKASDAEILCFLWSVPEQTAE